MLNTRVSRASRARVGSAVVAMLALWTALPPAAEAAIRGTPGYSGTLSSNPSVRKQQLLCDPLDPLSGSSSTTWDPAVSRLQVIRPVAFSGNDGYMIAQAFVEIPGGFVNVTSQANAGTPFDIPNQTGYVQVFFQSTGNPPPGSVGSALDPGYEFRSRDGVAGTDTHRLEFAFLPADDFAVASYTTYADRGPGAGGRGTQPDSLTSPLFTPNTVGPDQIAPVTVRGSLAVPEPSALLLIGLVGLPLLARRR